MDDSLGEGCTLPIFFSFLISSLILTYLLPGAPSLFSKHTWGCSRCLKLAGSSPPPPLNRQHHQLSSLLGTALLHRPQGMGKGGGLSWTGGEQRITTECLPSFCFSPGRIINHLPLLVHQAPVEITFTACI